MILFIKSPPLNCEVFPEAIAQLKGIPIECDETPQGALVQKGEIAQKLAKNGNLFASNYWNFADCSFFLFPVQK